MIALLLLPVLAWGSDLGWQTWEDTIDDVAAGDFRDTTYTNVFNMGLYPAHDFYWRTVKIEGVDTIFAADTVYLMTQHGISSLGPWVLFDSTKIILNGGADTTLQWGVRINKDSSAYAGNYWRVKWVNGYTTSDTTDITGNVYNYLINVYFEGK